MGEETDGVVESVSKLQSKVKALSGVNILTDTGAYKDTYTIIKEIAQVWDQMNDIDRAALLELLAGKNRSNAMAAMLTNIEDLEGAYQDALDAEGSAMAENEKQLNSIQGRITLFKNAVQTMWSDALDSSWIKFFVNLGTEVVKAVDAFGLFKSALAGVVSYLLISKKINPVTMFKEISANISNYGQALERIKAIQSVNGLGEAGKISTAEFNAQNISAYAAAVSDLTAKQQAAALASAGLTKAQIEEAMAKNGVDQANIKQAVSEAQVTTEKTKQTTVTAANAAAMAAEGTVKLSAESTNWLLAQGETELTLAKIQEAVATGQLTAAQAAEIISAFGLTAANQGLSTSIHGVAEALKSLMASNPVGWIMLAISLIISLITWIANMTPASEKLKNEIKELDNEIEGLNSELQTTADRIKELEGKHSLSFVEKEELEKLRQTNDELERKLRLLNESKESKQKELQKETKKDYEIDFVNQKTSDNIGLYITNKDSERYGVAKTFQNEYTNGRYSGVINDNLRNAVRPYSEELYQELQDIDYFADLSDKARQKLEEINIKVADELNGDLAFIETSEMNKEDRIREGIEKYNELKEEWNELINTDTSNMSGSKKEQIDARKKKIETSMGELKTILASYGTELYQYLDDYGADVDDEFAQKLREQIANIDKALNPGEYYTEQFDALLEKYPEVKKKLYSLAEAGELTEDALNGADYQNFRNELNQIGLSIQDAVNQINSLGAAAAHAKLNHVDPVGNTFSNYSDMIEKITAAESVQNEVIYDKIQLTEEQGEALKTLIGDEKEYADAIDTTNGYVVKNANVLNRLINKKKQEAVNTAVVERAQARLRYKELYKQIAALTNAQSQNNNSNVAKINTLYQEMSAIQKVIAKYSLFEQQLRGVTKAYSDFEEAQSIDSEHDYMSKTEDMLVSAIKAYQTGDLGTETAQIAIKALVPDAQFEGLDTVDEKAEKAYKYLTETLNKYFVLEFDDDGAIQSAEMKMGNLRKFIEDGFSNKVFDGADWQHFEWSDEFLAGLEEAPDKLQYFADQMGVTKEIALAAIQEINNKDIEWLNGDYSSLFDQIVPETLDSKLQSTTEKLAELNVQFANGKISQEDYETALSNLKLKLYGLQNDADVACNSFMDINDKMDESQKKLESYQKQLETGTDSDGNALTSDQIDEINKKYTQELQNYEGYLKQKKDLENKYGPMTEYTVSVALEKNGIDVENINEELTSVKAKMQEAFNSDNFKGVNESLENTYGVIAKINDNGDIEYSVTDNTSDDQKETLEELGALNDNGTVNIDCLYSGLTDEQKAEIDKLGSLQDKKNLIDYYLSMNGVDTVQTAIDNLAEVLNNIYKLLATSPIFSANVDQDTKTTLDWLLDKVNSWVGEHWASFKARVASIFGGDDGEGGDQESNGTAHINGVAHASGNWGLKRPEHNSLVGELGTETVVDPHTGRYYTVGDKGAELIDLPKDAIIFNHRQTEELFKNGHIGSRGKMAGGQAFAEGNAHVTVYPPYTTSDQWTGTGYSDWKDTTYDAADTLQYAADSISDAADDLSDTADKFDEMFDWFAVLLEEIDDDLNYVSAKLENAVGISAKNSLQDEMININKLKLTELGEGYKLYADYAAELLGKVPEQYRDLAEKGGVALTHFLGEANQEVVEAINNYREWAQKASDVRTQQQQVKKEITSISLEKVQTIADEYDRVITKITTLNDLLQANVDLIEEQGKRTSAVMYEEMIKNSSKELDELQKKRDAMQKEFDAQVSAGNIDVGSEEWYEGISAIQDVDKSIIDCRKDIEGFQNSINQLHWDNFDGLIEAIDNVGNEISNLGDLIDDEDITDEMGNWTDKGITKMGLLAQEMERAQYRAKQYAEQIEYLNQEYAAGKYSTDEYNEKLQELKDGQWDSIKSYEAAKDAIIELNKARIESVKDGINKELEAYQKLIDTKKKELQLSKD